MQTKRSKVAQADRSQSTADSAVTMPGWLLAKPIRIEPAFEDREFVRRLLERNGPYRSIAAYLPGGSDDTGDVPATDPVRPWFRETWALGGRVMIAGAELILHNPRFMAAAQALFPCAEIVPRMVVVNVNAPMPAGIAHVDVPVFRGANRERFTPRLLMAMGASRLFEPWRLIEAGAIAWFYEGPGGGFDYWPDGPNGPMQTEHAPFGNVAIVADSDRMYHRIARIGPASTPLPRMTARAEIRLLDDGTWCIFDQDECRARYPKEAIRLAVVWKAEALRDSSEYVRPADLTPPRILEILRDDLLRRDMDCGGDVDLLQDPQWIGHVYRTYMRVAKAARPLE